MRIVFVAVLTTALFAASCAAAEELRPQLDDMVRHFARVVFGEEEAKGRGHKVIAKWDGLVKLSVQGRYNREHLKQVQFNLLKIAKLTGLKFRQVQPGKADPGIDMLFMTRREMLNLKGENIDPNVVRSMARNPTTVCFFMYWTKSEERIVRAIVVVNVERDRVAVASCLKEELTQVMGLRNDVDTYWSSMFNTRDVSVDWSPWDELYLKTLYDPRIEAGMKPVDALYEARRIFAEALSKHR